MRHRNSGRKLGRTWEHRKALMKNMARSLVEHERIRTTEAKAKELRILADKLVTMALEDSLHARRQAYSILGSHHSVQKLFERYRTPASRKSPADTPASSSSASRAWAIAPLWR